MKTALKVALTKAGLLDPLRFLLKSARIARPSLIRDEVVFRWKGLPDGYPAPSPRLIFLIIGIAWAGEYYASGKLIVDDMVALLRRNGIAPERFRALLDFGCGCGRLIRHFSALGTTRLHGTDYNQRLVDWCAMKLTFGTFATNGLAPPLRYADGTFDFIYARSVFTHMGMPLQKEWMQELRRILADGGVLYFTMHGERSLGSLGPEDRARYHAGELVTINESIEGDNKCAAFASRLFVERNLLEGFELVDYIPDRESTHLRQDIYLVRKTPAA